MTLMDGVTRIDCCEAIAIAWSVVQTIQNAESSSSALCSKMISLKRPDRVAAVLV